MTRDRFGMPRGRVFPQRMLFAFSAENATVKPKVAEATSRASSDDDKVLLSVGRKRAEGILAPLLQYEGDCLAEVPKAILTGRTLAIGSGHFGAVGHEPGAVPLNDGCEFAPSCHERSAPCYTPQQ